MHEINDLDIGRAGEHLVCADLILSGYNAFLSEQGLPFDVVGMIDDRLIRIQVKKTREKRPVPQRVNHTPAYLFHIRRCGKGGRKEYSEVDFDIMALVALDIRKIAYISLQECRQTMHINEERFLTMGSIQDALNFDPIVKRDYDQPDIFVSAPQTTEAQEALTL